MTVALITKPAVEPVMLAGAKSHLRIDITDEDVFVSELIVAARQYLEQICGLRLITQSWRQYEDCWPNSHVLNLELRPVKSVQAITVYDADGTPSVIPPTDYQVDAYSQTARIHMPGGVSAGQSSIQAMNGIEVDFTVGFGDTGVDVPDTLKRAILMLVAHWYEFRGAISPQEQPVSIPPGFETLIASFKRIAI